MKKTIPFYLIAIGVIIIDQVSKLLVYHHMALNSEFNVIGEWFRIHYLLNPGMAFGLRLNSEYGKLALTIFRLLAMVGIGYYLYFLVKRQAHRGLLICMGLILGGAIGNVIDSTFYGVFLEDNAVPGSSTPWFHGQVIDMLYFPIINGYYPDWIPYLGGDRFQFFSPVFNIADSSIFLGVVTILIMQRRFFPKAQETTMENVEEEGFKEPAIVSVNPDEEPLRDVLPGESENN